MYFAQGPQRSGAGEANVTGMVLLNIHSIFLTGTNENVFVFFVYFYMLALFNTNCRDLKMKKDCSMYLVRLYHLL